MFIISIARLVQHLVISLLSNKPGLFSSLESCQIWGWKQISILILLLRIVIKILLTIFILFCFYFSSVPVLKYVVLCWKFLRSKPITGRLFLLTLPDSTVILQLTFWLAWWSDDDDDDLLHFLSIFCQLPSLTLFSSLTHLPFIHHLT